MNRLALGLVFLVWSLASLATEAEQDAYGPKLDLLIINLPAAHSENSRRRSDLYKFSASVVLVRMPDDSQNGFVASGNPLGLARLEPRRGVAGNEHSGPQAISGGDRPYLSPLLSIGSQGQRVNLRLRRHSLFLQYRQDFH